MAASMIPAGVTEQSIDIGMGSREGNVTSFASLSLASRTDSLSIGTSYTTGVSGRNVELSSAYSGSGDHASILRDIHVLTSAGIMQLTDRYAGRLYMDATSASGLGGSSIASFLRVPPVVRAMIMLEDFSRRGQEYANKLAEDKAKEAAEGKGNSSAATGGDGEDPGSDDERDLLHNDLCNQEQMSQPGTIIAGPGAKKAFKNAEKFAKDFGGSTEDWVKKTSTDRVLSDGKKWQIHWVENLKTGQRVNFKSQIMD